jgi:adenosylmethionine-8-amino-7-oxononanoate aminotransferase
MFVWVVSIFALLVMAAPAFAQEEVQWEHYFEATHQAFEHGHYWEAHRMFAAALEAAQRSGQKRELADRLESLADQYKKAHHPKVAEHLYKRASKIRMEARSRDVICSHRS